MATLKDVALKAGVSAMTVSHVLNGTKSVRPELKTHVLEVATTLNYQPNRSARALRTGQSFTLGLIVPDLTNPFFPELIETLEQVARRQGYATILIDSNRDINVEQQGFQLLVQYGVDGVIWCPHNMETPTQIPPLPVVVIDRPRGTFDSLSADHYAGGKLQGEFVLEQGHKDVGILKGPQTFINAKERYQGLIETLGRLKPRWQFEVPFGFTHTLSPEIIKALKKRKVSIIVAPNDVVAIATLRALHELGIRVPEDVSLISFDDTFWASLVYPMLTTIRQPIAELATCAVDTLLKRIRQPQLPRQHITLPVTLVVR